jgi:hypothetical protein
VGNIITEITDALRAMCTVVVAFGIIVLCLLDFL